jgi:glycosyltransferase involved in cell wall biosynthesis
VSRLSVIIPCFNQAHYLRDALDSVLAQTFDAWEAIVVDDGSIDDTAAVATSFADPRIRYIHQENQGLSAARNTGIRVAQGEYLAFLDADDEWAPQFLQTCVDYLGRSPDVAAVYTGSCLVDRQGEVLPHRGNALWSGSELRSRLLEAGFFPVSAVVVRTVVVRELGLFDTSLTSVEDWDLWLRVLQHHEMHGIDEPLARYRVYPGSMSTDAPRMHANRMAVLAKHFGLPEGDLAAWPEDKRRAYALAYRATALGYIQQGEPDQGWRFLGTAVETYPPLLQRLDTFYELACGHQTRGYQGHAASLDLERGAVEMLTRLGDLIAQASPPVGAQRQAAYGNAYLALAMLSDQAGRWNLARDYLWRAIRCQPSFLRDPGILRRFLKLCAGRRLIGWLRSVCVQQRAQGSK